MLQEKVMASKSFFNAKELEKMAAGVGISGMIFKKELQTMIDEDMIVCEKIGGGNFYWKLPGDAANALNKVRTQMHPAHLASQFVRSFRWFTGWPREVGMHAQLVPCMEAHQIRLLVYGHTAERDE